MTTNTQTWGFALIVFRKGLMGYVMNADIFIIPRLQKMIMII